MVFLGGGSSAKEVSCLKYTTSKSCADKCGAYFVNTSCNSWFACSLTLQNCNGIGGEEKTTPMFEVSYNSPRAQVVAVASLEPGQTLRSVVPVVCWTKKLCTICSFSEGAGAARCSVNAELESQCYVNEYTLSGTPCTGPEVPE